MNLISGKGETSSRLPALAYPSPEAVQTTGTVAQLRRGELRSRGYRALLLPHAIALGPDEAKEALPMSPQRGSEISQGPRLPCAA